MRISRTAGLVVSSVACGALAFGSAGAAIAAPDPASPAAESISAAVPLPGADKLTSQVKLLDDMGSVLTPVTDLIKAVIAGEGKLSPEDVAKHKKAVQDALDKLPKAPAAAPAVPAGVPAVPALPGAPSAADPGLDLKVKAVADLRVKVDALLKAVTAGDAAAVVAAVQATLTATINVVVSIVIGGGLPAPDLPGLPALPTLPGLPTLPTLPGSPVA